VIFALCLLIAQSSEPASTWAGADVGCAAGARPRVQDTGAGREVFCAGEDTLERHGAYRRFYPSGALAIDGRYEHGKKAGLWRTYFENGQLDSEGQYDNDAPQGRWTYWCPNGARRLAGIYEDGHRSGPWTEWYESGQKKSLRFYEEGALARGGTEWDEAGNERPIGQTRLHLSLGMLIGWAVVSSVVDLNRTPPVVGHRFAFGGRPELLFTPRMTDVGLGVYGEVFTSRSFQDVGFGGGVLMRFGTHAIKAVPSAGVYGRAYLGRTEPGITAGLFVGIHDHKNLASMASGLRIDLRHTLGRDRDLSLTFGIQLDLSLVMLPVMIAKGIPWFPR
jgi:hypothetical protein